MSTVRKRDRDKAMRIICTHFETNTSGSITPAYLTYHGLRESLDPEHIVKVLEAMGYVTTRIETQGNKTLKFISLTPAGKRYFEDKADISHEKRVQNIRYIVTTIIAALALILSGISLAAQLGLIQLPPASPPM